MTQTAAQSEPNPSHQPIDLLMNLIVACLAPMFLGVTGGDIRMAHTAAADTVDAYRAHNNADLIAVAQIIAFGHAALGSLSHSMADDITLSMTLRLRGNANALNRSAEQNRRAIRQGLHNNPRPQYAATTTDPETPVPMIEDTIIEDAVIEHAGHAWAEPFLTPEAAQELAAESEARLRGPELCTGQTPIPPPAQIAAITEAMTDHRHEAKWATVMINEAAKITDNLLNIPLSERSAASLQALALRNTANELLTSSRSPPALQTESLEQPG